MHCQKYVCMYVRILCMYVCMYVRTYVCMYVCMCVYVQVQLGTCTHVHTDYAYLTMTTTIICTMCVADLFQCIEGGGGGVHMWYCRGITRAGVHMWYCRSIKRAGGTHAVL